jgi:hypothetical protein
MRMLQSAEFGTLRAEAPNLARQQARSVGRPGIRSCLPARLGIHRLWMTSSATELDLYRPADRQMELVGGR